MRILGIDHGTVRIGLAVSDELKMIAHPLEFVSAHPIQKFVDRLKALIRDKEVELIVVGMPRNMDGSYGEATEKVRQFLQVLREAIVVPIETWDERLTSVQANRFLREAGVKGRKQRQRVDQSAAAILLQSYLDRKSMPPDPGGLDASNE